MATAPYRPVGRAQRRSARSYDPAEVIAYADTHGTAQAAQHFGIDERSVRRIRQKAEAKVEPPAPGHDIGATYGQIVALSTPAPVELDHDEQQHYATVHASAVARDGQMWKCPACGELMAPLPGTTGAEWAASGCYLCATPKARKAAESDIDYVNARTSDTEHEAEVPDMSAGQDNIHTASQSDETTGHVPVSAAPVVPDVSGPVRTMERPIVYRDRVVTRVVRVPVERQTNGVLTWASEHLPPVQVLVAVLIALVLMVVASFG